MQSSARAARAAEPSGWFKVSHCQKIRNQRGAFCEVVKGKVASRVLVFGVATEPARCSAHGRFAQEVRWTAVELDFC